jgi:hypothetical protein
VAAREAGRKHERPQGQPGRAAAPTPRGPRTQRAATAPLRPVLRLGAGGRRWRRLSAFLPRPSGAASEVDRGQRPPVIWKRSHSLMDTLARRRQSPHRTQQTLRTRGHGTAQMEALHEAAARGGTSVMRHCGSTPADIPASHRNCYRRVLLARLRRALTAPRPPGRVRRQLGHVSIPVGEAQGARLGAGSPRQKILRETVSNTYPIQ